MYAPRTLLLVGFVLASCAAMGQGQLLARRIADSQTEMPTATTEGRSQPDTNIPDGRTPTLTPVHTPPLTPTATTILLLGLLASVPVEVALSSRATRITILAEQDCGVAYLMNRETDTFVRYLPAPGRIQHLSHEEQQERSFFGLSPLEAVNAVTSTGVSGRSSNLFIISSRREMPFHEGLFTTPLHYGSVGVCPPWVEEVTPSDANRGSTGQTGYDEQRMITFHFEDTPVGAVARFLAELTGKHYVIENARDEGRIDIKAGLVSVHEAHQMFISAVKSLGYDVSIEGDTIRLTSPRLRAIRALRALAGRSSPTPK